MIAPRHQLHAPWDHAPTWVPPPRALDAASRVIIEIGPGNGSFLRHLAQNFPEHTIIGVELQEARFDQQRQRCRDCPNVAHVWGNARIAVPRLIAFGVRAEQMYILFPDPWPKRKHSAHRLFTAEFVNACCELLTPNGELHFITDDPAYAAHTDRVLRASQLHNLYTTPYHKNPTDLFPTFFAELWKKKNRTIHEFRYQKIGDKIAR